MPKAHKNSHYRTSSRSHCRRPGSCRQCSHSSSRHRQSCHRSTSHSPCNMHRSPHHTRRYRKSPTPRFHKVSHITASRHSTQESKLPTDVASDGHMAFHTTLQMITKQGSKPIPVKVDPGADVLSTKQVQKTLHSTLTKAGNLKQKSWHPTRHTWAVHNNTSQQFLGFFIADIHDKTQPEILLVRFYVFKDTTSPKILQSYTASERLDVVKFQIPNEVPSTALDTISSRKHVAFRTPLYTYKQIKPRNNGQKALKPAIMIHAFQDHALQKHSLLGHSLQIIPLSEDHSFQKPIISGPFTTKWSYFRGPFYHSWCL